MNRRNLLKSLFAVPFVGLLKAMPLRGPGQGIVNYHGDTVLGPSFNGKYTKRPDLKKTTDAISVHRLPVIDFNCGHKGYAFYDVVSKTNTYTTRDGEAYISFMDGFDYGYSGLCPRCEMNSDRYQARFK